MIKKWGEAHQIATTVHEEPFRNFGYNRTLSGELAHKTYPEADYLVLIDADMELSSHQKFTGTLDKIGYTVLVKSGFMHYDRLTLISNKYEWECVGVTHEYWRVKNQTVVQNSRILELWIDDHCDGGARHDKFERDIRLLTQGLLDEPKNERYMFYLAQSYYDTQQYDLAIEWYTKRVEAGGWIEEQWYAAYKICQAYFRIQDCPKAVDAGLKAFGMRPTRIEPLYLIIKYYRENSHPQLAYQLYQIAPKTIPMEDILFVEHPMYTHLLKYELSIIGYYGGPHAVKLGRTACSELIATPDLPQYIYDACHNNLKYYNQRTA